MIICTTPSLGFSPDIQAADYPYTVGQGLPTPQEGSIVHVVDTETGVGDHYQFADVGSGVFGWQAVPDPVA